MVWPPPPLRLDTVTIAATGCEMVTPWKEVTAHHHTAQWFFPHETPLPRAPPIVSLNHFHTSVYCGRVRGWLCLLCGWLHPSWAGALIRPSSFPAQDTVANPVANLKYFVICRAAVCLLRFSFHCPSNRPRRPFARDFVVELNSPFLSLPNAPRHVRPTPPLFFDNQALR